MLLADISLVDILDSDMQAVKIPKVSVSLECHKNEVSLIDKWLLKKYNKFNYFKELKKGL